MTQMTYQEDRYKRKMGMLPALPTKKERKPIAKISQKKQEEIKAKGDGDSELDKFFDEMRKKMTSCCQCGCGLPSQKKDDTFFRYCICHIFPKTKFKSIATHPLNWVERTFWQGHHTNFDEHGMDKWPNMADWDDIKAKVKILLPLVAEPERKYKFYRKISELVESN